MTSFLSGAIRRLDVKNAGKKPKMPLPRSERRALCERFLASVLRKCMSQTRTRKSCLPPQPAVFAVVEQYNAVIVSAAVCCICQTFSSHLFR